VIHRGVDEVDAAQQVVGVIEMLDEMAQALGGVGGQVENVFKLVFAQVFARARTSVTEP
jgi:hypothetical protein